jgi:hypothetical protein
MLYDGSDEPVLAALIGLVTMKIERLEIRRQSQIKSDSSFQEPNDGLTTFYST